MGRDCTHSPAGDLSKLKELDASWASACAEGHLWIVLPSTLDESLKADISAWRNQDQNENQPITDGELIRLCSLCVEDFLKGVPGGKGCADAPEPAGFEHLQQNAPAYQPNSSWGALSFRVLDGAGQSH